MIITQKTSYRKNPEKALHSPAIDPAISISYNQILDHKFTQQSFNIDRRIDITTMYNKKIIPDKRTKSTAKHIAYTNGYTYYQPSRNQIRQLPRTQHRAVPQLKAEKSQSN